MEGKFCINDLHVHGKLGRAKSKNCEVRTSSIFSLSEALVHVRCRMSLSSNHFQPNEHIYPKNGEYPCDRVINRVWCLILIKNIRVLNQRSIERNIIER